MTENFVNIGFTKKPHGLKGEIKLHIEEKYLEDLLETDVVVLNLKGKPTPFFVADLRVGNAIIAKFEDIDTPEAAAALASKELMLRLEDILPDDLREVEVEGLQFEKCVGYELFDGETSVGTIAEVLEFPQQEMAVLHIGTREVLIPLHIAFVVRQDDAARKIYLNLPDGILDL